MWQAMSPSAPVPEIPEAAPLERRVRRVIRPLRRGPEPEVPVERGRRVVLFQRPVDRLRPDRPIGPEMHLAHRPDRAGLDQLADLARAIARVALVPHLGHDLGVTTRVVRQHSHLAHGPRQRLLNVGVLPRLHRKHSGRGVRMVGRGHGHRVDALRLAVEHLAIVLVAFRLGIGLERVFSALPIHVAQRVEVLAFHAPHVAAAHAAHADARDVELVARRPIAPPQDVPWHDGERQAAAYPADEFPSRDAFACHDGPSSVGRHGLGRTRAPRAKQRCE